MLRGCLILSMSLAATTSQAGMNPPASGVLAAGSAHVPAGTQAKAKVDVAAHVTAHVATRAPARSPLHARHATVLLAQLDLSADSLEQTLTEEPDTETAAARTETPPGAGPQAEPATPPVEAITIIPAQPVIDQDAEDRPRSALESENTSPQPTHDPEAHEPPAYLPELPLLPVAFAPAGSVQWTINEQLFDYSLLGVFVMPGEVIDMKLEHADGLAFKPLSADESFYRVDTNHWRWRAPQTPGHVALEFHSGDDAWKSVVNALVKVPAEQMNNGRLGTFRIGPYPSDDELASRKRYVNPDGFIKVTKQTKDVMLSPHFRLGEFVSKQVGGFPKYVYLNERLIIKLERVRQAMEEAGYEVHNLHVMSGYRTPFYNKTIGNVKFSRHVFGDAADIFIDNNGNGRMDDLNGDGKADLADALIMQQVVEGLADDGDYAPLVGGLGVYGPAPHRGPFIHIDTRGYPARWVSK